MARPKSKEELLLASETNMQKLWDFINNLPEEKRTSDFPEGTLNRNIRDVLAHLHHWHLLVFQWYEIGMKGEKPSIPAEGYTWRTTPELNRSIREQYATISFKESKKLLGESHQKITDMIRSHTNDELFERKRYKWTGTNALGAYFVSATSSHYDWALKLIKKATR
ncbi:MAG: ClbS/DfsB family four-helix bundle protein [Balneolales bacterium]|nr:ClbS/DfsB family four-helix bundle protein [Balneolales bacterium]